MEQLPKMESRGGVFCALWVLALFGCVAGNAVNSPLDYYLLEELPPNTLIGDIATDSNLDGKYDSATLRKLRFQFLTTPKLDKQYFSVEEETGIIRTTERIDRDKICPRKIDCIIKFDIAVQPIQFFQIIKVQVDIIDINDNHPMFPQRRMLHKISESAIPGTSLVIPPASDPDSGMNGIKEYELVQKGEVYDLQVKSTADGATDLRLILREALDRERMDHDKVFVLAYDGGNPTKSGSIAVDVDIVDANDNNPQFDNTTYHIQVMENIPIRSTILRVRARDVDSGDNGKIAYQFSKHTLQEYGHLFGINDETGEIYVKGTLDYESGSIYLLSLIAHDMGPDSLPAHSNAIVRVEDVNDNAPQISVNTLTPNGEAQVLEGSKLGTFVAHISVIDVDSGTNGRFTCSIDDPRFLLQKLYLTEFKIVTATVFDREERDEYEISLVCKDRGIQPQISIEDIRVRILDANDHTPTFLEESYTAVIQENNPIGINVIQVNATDKDSGPNGRVRYKLEEKMKDMLSVDPKTGVITSNIIFDFEESPEIAFDVVAYDMGDPSKSSLVPVRITLIDLDDERPVFEKEFYSLGTFEHQQPGTGVGSVTAHDADSSPFNRFFYYLDPNSVSADLFQIDPNTGAISTTKSLDREMQPVHYIVAIATPADDPSYTSTASVTVYVADKNDNAPVFDFPTVFNNTIEVSSHAPVGHVIGRLKAHDLDKSLNAKLTFLIMEGNQRNVFTLDAVTGAIAVNADLNKFADTDTFIFKVQVQDGGEPQLADSADLKIVANKNLPFALHHKKPFLSGENLTIVLAFALATVFVAIIIIIAIIVIIRRSKQTRNRNHTPTNEKKAMLPHSVLADDRRTVSPVRPEKSTSNHYVSADEVDKMKNGFALNKRHSACDQQDGNSTEYHQLTKESSGVPPAASAAWPPDEDASPRIPQQTRLLQPRQSPTGPAAAESNLVPDSSADHGSMKDAPSWQQLNGHLETPAVSLSPLPPDLENVSVGSASNSDSGRGLSSEEGGHDDHKHHIRTLVQQLHMKKKQLQQLTQVLPPGSPTECTLSQQPCDGVLTRGAAADDDVQGPAQGRHHGDAGSLGTRCIAPLLAHHPPLSHIASSPSSSSRHSPSSSPMNSLERRRSRDNSRSPSQHGDVPPPPPPYGGALQRSISPLCRDVVKDSSSLHVRFASDVNCYHGNQDFPLVPTTDREMRMGADKDHNSVTSGEYMLYEMVDTNV